MTLPTELLAGYVDGALAADERAVVEAHLASCPRCGEEVALATAGRSALRALPVPQGPDLAQRFSPERVASLSSSQRPRTSPWAKVAPALAAAAVVVLIALALPRLGQQGEGDQTVAGGAGAGTPAPAEERPRLEIDDTDYDEEATAAKATMFASRLRAGASEAQGALGEADAPDVAGADDSARYAGNAASARARACLRQAFPGYPGTLVRIARATFEGMPAFFGTVVEGPGAGQPPDTVSVWVAAVEDCSIITITSTSL